MRTTLCSIITLLTFVTLAFVPNTFAQDASPEYVVRVIYFLPNDREPQPDIDATLNTQVKDAQQFYADVMEFYGFDRKNFQLENNENGKVVVHHVNGEYNDTYYHNGTFGKVVNELSPNFDTSKNIYFVAIDISSERFEVNRPDSHICGSASAGWAATPASGTCFNFRVIAHELGHTFGLSHDSFNYSGTDPMVDSFCTAEWLDVHSYFNTESQTDFNQPTTVKILTPSRAPSSNAIRFSFEVSDADRLHQAQLFIPTLDSVVACKRLNSESTTVDFDITYVVSALNSVSLKVIDVNGNHTQQDFRVDISDFLLPPKKVTIPDANLAAAIRAYTDLPIGAEITTETMVRLTRLFQISDDPITDITGLEYATNLVALSLYRQNKITDFSSLGELRELRFLEIPGTSISDIAILSALTKLQTLYLYDNAIQDVSALAGLTNLKTLELQNNQIKDITQLAGLTRLTYLDLGSNQISDVSPLTELVNLEELRLAGNPITDRAPLLALQRQNPDIKISIDPVPIVTNSAPVFTDGDSTTRSVLENTGVGINIGSPVSATDADGDLLTYTLSGTDAASFSIVSTSGQLQTHAPLDYETKKSYMVTVKVSDGTLTASIMVPISVTDVNEAPMFNSTTVERSVAENTPAGMMIGAPVIAIDPDDSGEVIYTLGGTDMESFGIDSMTGQLKTIAELDYETKATYTVTITATDEAGLMSSAVIVTVMVTDMAEFSLSVPSGISLIHVPLKVTAVDGVSKTIESVSDLYDALGGAATVNLLITHDPKTQEWKSYFDARDKGEDGDKVLTDDLGIIAGVKAPVAIRLSGDALGTNGRSSITLYSGINLVGVPLKDSRIARVSDLFSLEGIRGNVFVIIVSDKGVYKVVAQADDDGDIQIMGGQSFIMSAREAATVAIEGDGWTNAPGTVATPPMALTGIEVRDTTPVLAVSGSIVFPVGGRGRMPRLRSGSGSGFRVTVKNLSTGKVDTSMTDDERSDYRFTFVDIETGRAAQIGDILEISAQSSMPLVGVQPLRHIVTAEDVRRVHIPLAELVAYEIPAKTELLLNYPNPFNPETWIPYRLAHAADVEITIYNTRGTVVRRLDVGHQSAGFYTARAQAAYWDGRNEHGESVASGVYFYQFRAGDYTALRRMVILK